MSDTHSSSNQRRTEPVPPTGAHDVPDAAAGARDARADAGAGTSTGPGPREGVAGAARAEPYPAGPAGPGGPAGLAPESDREASRVPGSQGMAAEPFGVDTAAGARRTSGAVSAVGADSGGDPHGVPVPSSVPAEGTSEEAAPVDGVRLTAIAREGLADGEPDNRSPQTSTF
jgi:hypothetical protein